MTVWSIFVEPARDVTEHFYKSMLQQRLSNGEPLHCATRYMLRKYS